MGTDEVNRNRDVGGADIQGDSEREPSASAAHDDSEHELPGDEPETATDDDSAVVLGGDEVFTNTYPKPAANDDRRPDESDEAGEVDSVAGENGSPRATEVASADLEGETTLPTPPPMLDGPSHDDVAIGLLTADERATSTESESTGIQERPVEGVLEMRQVAGLTAGSMMRLGLGRAFEFNESNEGLSFSLRVLEDGEVVVHPGTARAVVDEVEVNKPMVIGEGILNVSSACFSVRPPRRPTSSSSRLAAIGATFASTTAIPVPPLGAESPLAAELIAGSRLGTLLNRNPLTRGAVGQNAWDFLQSIREMRAVVAERHRLMHPDPEELKTRLSRLDPGLWERSRDHSQFARFSIGYATIPWEPRFDNPELIPEILHEPIVDMSLLPWVPVTANLLYGPLGIVGRRAARLAAARHAVLSLAALSMPGEIRFAIRTGRNTATSWSWARALPPMMSSGEGGYVVTLIDGIEQPTASELASSVAALEEDAPLSLGDTVELPFDDASESTGNDESTDLPTSSAAEAGGAMILLAETEEELAEPCGTVLQVETDGTGMVTNHLGETIQVTPIGVTEAFAHDMATRITDILTESFL